MQVPVDSVAKRCRLPADWPEIHCGRPLLSGIISRSGRLGWGAPDQAMRAGKLAFSAALVCWGSEQRLKMNDALRSADHISIIDEHAALVARIDLIDSSLRTVPHDQSRIIADVKELLEITRVHFQHEELVMAEAGYSEIQAHARDHVYLRTSLTRFLESIEHCKTPILPDIGINLRSWLEFHIKKFDNTYLEAFGKPDQARKDTSAPPG